MNSYEVTDVFGIIMDEDEEEVNIVDLMRPDEALIDCLNRYGTVDMPYLSKATGMTMESVRDALQGVIFQEPEVFGPRDPYDISRGWVVSARYLNGNAREKFMNAQKANVRFGGHFESNIEALRKIIPEYINIGDIHISLGAAWIPEKEYSEFIKYLLRLSKAPSVTFSRELGRWKITATESAKQSVLNTITYGVRGNIDPYNTRTIKQYLTAIDIIEDTLNAKTVKVYDYIPKNTGAYGYFEYEQILNKSKTVEAQDRQKEIIAAFRDWVYADRSRVLRFESFYNEAFVGYTFTAYDGGFLSLPDLNPDVKFYPHQRNAIARVLLSGTNTVFAHDVGTGKTYEMISSVHELKRLGLSQKNLVVVPNNVLKATVDAHTYLYPKDNILAVYSKDFTPERRNSVLAKIACGDYVAIYMAYSSFDMIVMSKKYYINKYTREIDELKRAAFNTSDKYEKAALDNKAGALSKKLSKFISEAKESKWITFDSLGINTLVVDEAHNYKNIPIGSRTDNIVGLGGNSSKKCREMLEKVHFVDRVIFATGTPLTNSLADLFAFQMYLQPETLKLHRINSFDSWVNTFGKRETAIECDVDANSSSLRTVTRFSSFHNLGELMSLFAQICDFHRIDEDEEGIPFFSGYTDVCVKKSAEQDKYIKSLSERTELIRLKKIKRTEDNLLKVTTDGRKAALDIRLVDPSIPVYAFETTKIDACASKVVDIYRRFPQSTQVVFCDIGTPKEGFNVYDCLSEKLERYGVATEEIAYVHDATTEKAREKLFADMNSGKLKVVIGSTAKLGVGVNVQERLVALHHLSVPWRPADMVQREGRILRKGNTSEEVFIFRYITEGSFDAYSWQLLENKQKFISSFLSGTSATRDISDIADAVLSYAEVKALAIGNPLIKKRVEVSNLLERTKIASRERQRQLQDLRCVITETPTKIEKLRSLADIARKDFNVYTKLKEPVPNEERTAFGEELLLAVSENVGIVYERIFADYQGFTIVLPAKMREESPYIIIKSSHGGSYVCEIDQDKTPVGCTKAIDYILDHLAERAIRYSDEMERLKQQMKEAEEDIERENPYLQKIEGLMRELETIDKKLEEDAKENKAS